MERLKNFIGKFFKKEVVSDYETSAINDRITDIRARIAAIKSRNGWDQEPYQNIAFSKKLSETSTPDKTTSQKINVKNTDADALKAKLLGKKQ